MKLEIINSPDGTEYIEHITENGRTKIQFNAKFSQKYIDLIGYVNKYLASHNGKIISIQNSNSVTIIYLETE